MAIKFEFINTKSPKWHIWHTHNNTETGSIITFENNDTSEQYQHIMGKTYDYTSSADYDDFTNETLNILQKHQNKMPYDDDLLHSIMEKVVSQHNKVCDIINKNLHSSNTEVDTYKLQAEHQSATAMVEANLAQFEAERQELREKAQEEREALIAEASRLTGRVEAFSVTSKFVTVTTLMTIKKIKESGIYKELPNIKTWADYCKSIGFSREKVDLDLQNLNTFGEDFLVTGYQLGLGYRELRSLSKQVKSGNLEVKEAEVIIDGEVIPLDDKDELRDALDSLLKAKYKEIDEKDKTIQSQSETIEEKNSEISRLQESNKNFFNDKQKAEKALEELKGVGTIHGIPLDENADFQKIADIEREVEILYNHLSVVSELDLSNFNKKKLGAVVIKAMNLLHNFHQELCAKGVTEYYGEAFMPDEVMEADGKLETPVQFLRDNQ